MNALKPKSIVYVLICFILIVSCKKVKSTSNTDVLSQYNVSQNRIKSGNPMVKDVGMADPHIRIFNGKPYLYATRDEDKMAKAFTMPDWNIWSTDDLINWKLETTIDPTDTYMGASKRCWAPDAVYKNGNYYFYFSNGKTDTGVMIGKKPIGPFKDALGKPMLPENLTPTKEYDPTILIDDDSNKTAYVAFGHHRSADPDYYFMIAKLNEDMVSLAETPREIKITGEAKVLGGNDKPTLHKKNGLYYLSAGSHYAISKTIYGPYVKTGNSGNDTYGLNSRAHGNYFDWNGQSFHTWCHFHLGKDVARYRESYISYLHYKDNGEMVTDTNFLVDHFSVGVGQYVANWSRIEAEWYMVVESMSKIEGKNSSNNFHLETTKSNGYLKFPNVYGLSNSNVMTCSVSATNGGKIEIRTGSEKGELLGEIDIITKTKSFKTFSTKLSNLKDKMDIALVFKGVDTGAIAIDWFSFK